MWSRKGSTRWLAGLTGGIVGGSDSETEEPTSPTIMGNPLKHQNSIEEAEAVSEVSSPGVQGSEVPVETAPTGPPPIRKAKANWIRSVKVVRREINKLALDPFALKNFNTSSLITLKPVDVVVASYPRSGGQVVCHILYKLISTIQRKLGLPEMPLTLHRYESAIPETLREEGNIFHSKLRYPLISKTVAKAKIFYVIRNPKHTAIDLYNCSFNKEISFVEFVNLFLDKDSDPTNPYNYKRHFLEFLENPDELSVHFLKLDDLNRDPIPVLQSLTNHLGVNFDVSTLSEAQITDILEETEASELADPRSMDTWLDFTRSIKQRAFGQFFDDELQDLFDTNLKINWSLVQSSAV